MINPVKFTVINFFSYLIVLSFFGFKAAFPLSIFFSFVIIFSSYKTFGLKGSLTLAIIYLLAFDSEVFYFSDFNIRIWYFYLIIIYLISAVQFFLKPNFVLKRKFLLEYAFAFILFLWSLYFLIIEDFISKINNIKYWVFYVGLIIILNNFFSKNLNRFQKILDFIISIGTFIAFWGIFQFFTNLLFIPNYQLDYFNIRPSAFFSETTWYSEFIFFTLILIILKILTHRDMLKLLYLVPFFLLGFMFSVTRNTFVAVFIYIFFTFLLSLIVEKKVKVKIIKSKILLTYVIALVGCILVFLPQLYDIVSLFALKFSGKDDSAQGRIEAYRLSIDHIFNGNILGNGFYWDKSQSTESGSALGSKSFNLFLMMGSIFGVIGGIIFIMYVMAYLLKLFYYYLNSKSIYIKYSLMIFIIFIQMAMFAPIHQFPFGMLIVSLSVFLFNIGILIHEKNNICYTTT